MRLLRVERSFMDWLTDGGNSNVLFWLLAFVAVWFCLAYWATATATTDWKTEWTPKLPVNTHKEKTIIDVLDGLYRQRDNYWTIERLIDTGSYRIGITPRDGKMMYGDGDTIEKALENFIVKYQ